METHASAAPAYTAAPATSVAVPEGGRIEALAVFAARGALAPHHYEPPPLGPLDLEIAITHCGMCHTDLHLINDDWGMSSFPLVPGHEIVGTVVRAGRDVAGERIGQRAGVGWLAGACFACEQCLSGNENLCANWQPTCVGRPGGYASHIRVDARLAIAIPDALSSAEAAPLLCGGITTFAPLARHGVGPKTRLGVVGVGGLGHLALQYGHAMGAHVTAFSTSRDKEAEARRLGADEFVATGEAGALAARAGSCDFILSTVPTDLPWSDYIATLRPNGRLCVVGIPTHDISFPAFPLIAGQKGIVGSAIGSATEIGAMLEFSARHRIVPLIERRPMHEANDALARLAENRVRYRTVLEN